MAGVYYSEGGCFVYFIGMPLREEGRWLDYAVKIGLAADPHKRLDALQIGNPVGLELLARFHYTTRSEAMRDEAVIHGLFKNYRIRGEWFLTRRDLLVESLRRSPILGDAYV